MDQKVIKVRRVIKVIRVRKVRKERQEKLTIHTVLSLPIVIQIKIQFHIMKVS